MSCGPTDPREDRELARQLPWKAKWVAAAAESWSLWRPDALGHDPRLLLQDPAPAPADAGDHLDAAKAVGLRTGRSTMSTPRSRTRASRLRSFILVVVSRPVRCPSDDGYTHSATPPFISPRPNGLDRNEPAAPRSAAVYAEPTQAAAVVKLVSKTAGYCWRNHNKATSTACMSHYGWARQDQDPVFVRIGAKMRAIFSYGFCFQPVRRIRQ